MIDVLLVRTEEVPLTENEVVTGITWIDDRIYIVFENSRKVVVYRYPLFDSGKFEVIEVSGMLSPCDIASSRKYDSVFIGDKESRCLWRVSVYNTEETKSVSNWMMTETPALLSLAGEDSLLIVSKSIHSEITIISLVLYDLEDGRVIRNVQLPTGIHRMWHAIQLPNQQFLISYERKIGENITRIVSEISTDGNIVRTIMLSNRNQDMPSTPIYILMIDSNQALIADDDKVFYFDGKQNGQDIFGNSMRR